MTQKLIAQILSVVIVILTLIGIYGYVQHQGVLAEKNRAALESAALYQELAIKYDTVNQKYTTLRAKKDAARQEVIIREDKIINENPDYYAGDCFDAVGLQHVKAAQGTTTDPR